MDGQKHEGAEGESPMIRCSARIGPSMEGHHSQGKQTRGSRYREATNLNQRKTRNFSSSATTGSAKKSIRDEHGNHPPNKETDKILGGIGKGVGETRTLSSGAKFLNAKNSNVFPGVHRTP